MGWHIRTGAWILNNGRIPAVDIFSFTKNGQPWIAWEWLSDVAMALTHLAGGLPAVILLALLLLGATAVCVYRSTVAASGHRFIALVLTGLAMAASTVHWLARPHLATPLMAAIFCLVLNRTENDGKPRHLWILPPLSAIWANLHGGFFVGMVLVITYTLGAFAEEFLLGVRKNAFRHARNYIWIAIGCAVASLINPYGYHLHVHIAQYLGSSFYFERISEFQSVDFHSFAAAYFETLLVLAIAASAWHLSSGKLTQALLLLSWTHLALFSARNIPIFAAVVSPAIGLATREWLECVASRSPASWLGKFSTSIAELEAGLSTIAQNRPKRQLNVLPCLAVALLALVLFHPGKVRTFRAEFDRDRFPFDAAAFLSQQTKNSEMRIYASWQWGGYLIYRLWPSLSVFNDGRTDFYGTSFVEDGLCVWNACPEWSSVLSRYGVDGALVPPDCVLAAVLRERRDWKLVYQDRTAVFFEKAAAGSEHREVPMSEANELTTISVSSSANEHRAPEPSNGSQGGSTARAASRRRLPDERHSLTHHFSVGGQEGYVTIGLYEDGTPGEMFIRMSKEGSTVSGLMDSFATAVSLALQYGVPLQVLCDKFSHTRFEPSGWSGNPKIGYAKSLMDYLFRWLELRFLKGEQGILFDLHPGVGATRGAPIRGSVTEALSEIVGLGDAPACKFCGSLMVRNGSCYRCMECGSTSGCS